MTNLENITAVVNRLQKLLSMPMESDGTWQVEFVGELEKMCAFRSMVMMIQAQKQAAGEWELDASEIPAGCPLDSWEICYAMLRMLGFSPDRSTAQTNILTGQLRSAPTDDEMSGKLAQFIIQRLKSRRGWN